MIFMEAKDQTLQLLGLLKIQTKFNNIKIKKMANVRVRWIDSVSVAATGNKVLREDVEIADIANGVQEYIDTAAPDGVTGLKYEVQAHDGAGDQTIQEVEGVNMDYIDTSSALTESLVAYWRWDNNYVDQVGSYTGVGTGTSFVAGNSGQAVRVDGGSGSGVEVPNETAFSFGNGTVDQPFSISMWLTFDVVEAGLQEWIFAKRGETVSLAEYQVGVYGGELFFALFSQGSATQIFKQFPIVGNFTAGQAHHLIVTYDGLREASGINLYIDNGASLGTPVPEPAYVAMSPQATPLTIGDAGFNDTYALTGNIDGLGLWDIELDAAQRTEIYDIQAAGNELL